MSQSPMAGLAAQGPLPAGMFRVRLGQQERYVWPVHLPGWLAIGWRVAGAEATAGALSTGAQTAEPPAPIAIAAGDLPEQDDAKPASTRGRRGRRRKEEIEDAVAPASISTEEVLDEAREESAEAGEPAEAEPAAEPTGDFYAAETAELPVLTALPDDLFDDPLI